MIQTMTFHSDPDSAMLDLETMGLGPNAAVIQIGVQLFNWPTGTLVGEGLQVDVDLHSSLMLGGEVDGDTVRWWRERGGLKPSGTRIDMRTALAKVASYLARAAGLKRVWAQGPSFDIAIMEGYYSRAGRPAPWVFHAARDTRTIYDLARAEGWQKPKEDTAHTALADCRQQIGHLTSAAAFLPRPGELELHRADYNAIQAAGFDSPGELLAAYRELKERDA